MDAFEQGVWGAKTKLKSFALKLYQNVDDADDAVQDTMTRALANRDKFEEGTNLMGWLGTILMNAFRGHVRDGRHRRVVFTDKPRYADHLPAASNPERDLIVRETFDAFNRLPPHQHTSMLFQALGFSSDEVAELLDTKPRTIRVRSLRGRTALLEQTGGLQ